MEAEAEEEVWGNKRQTLVAIAWPDFVVAAVCLLISQSSRHRSVSPPTDARARDVSEQIARFKASEYAGTRGRLTAQ